MAMLLPAAKRNKRRKSLSPSVKTFRDRRPAAVDTASEAVKRYRNIVQSDGKQPQLQPLSPGRVLLCEQRTSRELYLLDPGGGGDGCMDFVESAVTIGVDSVSSAGGKTGKLRALKALDISPVMVSLSHA